MDKPKRYRMRPKTVEAMRYTGHNGAQVCAWLASEGAVEQGYKGDTHIEWVVPDAQDEYGHAITHRALKGQWLVRSLKDDSLKAMSQQFFDSTYALDTQSY